LENFLIMRYPLVFCVWQILTALLLAQSKPLKLEPLLAHPIQPALVTGNEIREYLLARVPKLPSPSSADQWTADAAKRRRRFIEELVRQGWPREWMDAPIHVTDLGVMATGDGYRTRKLRLEILPGFQEVALLYEPASLHGKAPAILNLSGHTASGKAAEFTQKRCINQARQGILALNMEWPGYGEMTLPGNGHSYAAQLELEGARALGFFYLAMRKGLDYLYDHPNADRSRLGITGLSGGGWQSIVLGSIDERVSLSVPVAGFSSLTSRIERSMDIGDYEQNPADLYTVVDYPDMVAMMAPRPTLLIFNADDDCCFRAPMVKPYIYDQILPFFRLYSKQSSLDWHENFDPGTHNYELDNRLQSYSFFVGQWKLSASANEIPVAAEIRSAEELKVGLPENNLTILSLARKIANSAEHGSIPPEGVERKQWGHAQRTQVRKALRYHDVSVRHAWQMANTHLQGVDTRDYRFEFDNHLSSAAVWVKAAATPLASPATIVLHDEGRKAAAAVVSDRVNRGDQVLAADLLLTGEMASDQPRPVAANLLLTALGERPLGIRAAQLIGLAKWLRTDAGAGRIRISAQGLRSQMAALSAAALEPDLFSEVEVGSGIRSLRQLVDEPVPYGTAPELFCYECEKNLDVGRLVAIAGKDRISIAYADNASKKQ
jgi:hypothetical protein